MHLTPKKGTKLVKTDICTFIGGYFENGAWPWASSSAVIPKDQISALHENCQRHIKRMPPSENRAVRLLEVPRG